MLRWPPRCAGRPAQRCVSQRRQARGTPRAAGVQLGARWPWRRPNCPRRRASRLAFTPWPDAGALVDLDLPHTAVAALDIDDDRDLDLVLAADGQPLRAVLNDRLGRFHALAMPGASAPGAYRSLLVTDLDKDGLQRRRLCLRGGSRHGVAKSSRLIGAGCTPEWEAWPANARRWACAVAADLDLDTWPDLVGLALDPRGAAIAWARNEGVRLVELVPWGRQGAGSDRAPVGFTLADLVGDPLPDLLVLADGAPPRIAANGGNGRQWLALGALGPLEGGRRPYADESSRALVPGWRSKGRG